MPERLRTGVFRAFAVADVSGWRYFLLVTQFRQHLAADLVPSLLTYDYKRTVPSHAQNNRQTGALLFALGYQTAENREVFPN